MIPVYYCEKHHDKCIFAETEYTENVFGAKKKK